MKKPDDSSQRQNHLKARNGRSTDDGRMGGEVDAMHHCTTKVVEENGSDDGVDNLSRSSQASTQRPEAEKSDEERDQEQEVP